MRGTMKNQFEMQKGKHKAAVFSSWQHQVGGSRKCGSGAVRGQHGLKTWLLVLLSSLVHPLWKAVSLNSSSDHLTVHRPAEDCLVLRLQRG